MSAGEHLRAYQLANKQRTVEALKAAMGSIEAELEERGYYPENSGKVTLREVCRRAGLGESTLKNKTHSATAAMVRRWLARLKRTAPAAKPAAEDAKQARIAALTGQIERIAQNYNRFKIEYDALLKQKADLEEENADLKRRLLELTPGNPSVVPLPPRRR